MVGCRFPHLLALRERKGSISLGEATQGVQPETSKKKVQQCNMVFLVVWNTQIADEDGILVMFSVLKVLQPRDALWHLSCTLGQASRGVKHHLQRQKGVWCPRGGRFCLKLGPPIRNFILQRWLETHPICISTSESFNLKGTHRQSFLLMRIETGTVKAFEKLWEVPPPFW